jgi:hypothetical protein
VGRTDRPASLNAARWLAAAAAAALALSLSLAGTGFHLVPLDTGEEWRGITDPPGLLRQLAAVLLSGSLALWLRRRPAGVARALLPLGLAAAPLVPVILGVGDPLLALQGAVLAPLALAASTLAAWEDGRLRRWRPGSGTLFVLAALLYAALGARVPGPAGPQGDEPHYLVMAQSLLSDGDLDLRDEFETREYAAYFPGRLTPHASPASPPDRLYSIHAPGLPLLLLPGFALGGYPGARLLMGLLAAAAAALTHARLLEVTGRPGLALAGWAVLALTPPLPFYAVAIYPEVPAALATALFLGTARRDADSRGVLLAGCAAAALPWLHPRLLPLALLGAGLSAARRGPRPARLLAVSLVVVSLTGLLAYYRAYYGHASLAAAYGPGFATDVRLARIPWGGLALLFDRQFGLLMVSPVWFLALPGAWLLLRRRTGEGLRAVLLGASSFGVGAAFSMWWGGSCPPARFALPALPAAALLAAPALGQRPRLASALGGASAAVVALAAIAPRAIHNRANGQSGLLAFLAPGLRLDALLPSYLLGGPEPLALTALVLAAAAAVWRFGSRGLLGVAAAALVSASWLAGGSLIEPRRAARTLITDWDSDNALGPELDLARIRIPIDLRKPPWQFAPDEIRVSRRLDLPPGRYRVHVEGRAVDALATAHVLRLELTAQGLLLAREHLAEDRPDPSFELTLPVGARRLSLTGYGVQGRSRIDGVSFAPQALVRRSRRALLAWPARRDDDRYRVGSDGVLVTVLDRSTPEAGGFRLQGRVGRFAVEAPAGGRVRVRIVPGSSEPGDRLEWGSQVTRLGSPRALLQLAADAGEPLGPTLVVPVRLRSRNAWIAFEAAATAGSDPPDAAPPR